MILQKLVDYYDRLAADPSTATSLPMTGYSLQKVSFCVVINLDGTLQSFKSLQDSNGKKAIAQSLLVPGQNKSPGQGLNPGLLWDTGEYMLGFASKKADLERLPKKYESFKKRHLDLEGAINNSAFSAVCKFLREWSLEKASLHAAELEAITSNFGVFKISGQPKYVHNLPEIVAFLSSGNQEKAVSRGMCLVTGKVGPIARLHEPKIKGVRSESPPPGGGHLLVSFNDKAYESFGKEQGENAPVSENAAFRYTNALNYLLGRQDRRTQLGDATVVYWADKPTMLEEIFDVLTGEYRKANGDDASPEDKVRAEQVKAFLSQLRTGHSHGDAFNADSNVGFYILGLSPNASRLSVRFWEQSTVGKLQTRLRQFMSEVDIVGISPEYPVTVRNLINATVRIVGDKPDYDSLSPRLAGEIVRSILTGRPFPNELMLAVLQRIRADAEVTPIRAAAIKAVLIRNWKQAMEPYLNKKHPECAYHCGRLLAVLAFAQEEALGSVNAGVVRRSLGSVMATPALQLGRLQRAAEVGHIPKLERDLPEFVRDELKHINGAMGSDIPLQLSAREQSIFMLGFYQQLQFMDFVSAQVSSGRRVRTSSGEWVRSNGERQVAELLTKRGVPYAFEPAASLPSGPDRWPDFVVSSANGDRRATIFIEYLGMDTPVYNSRWQEKLRAYAEGGITEAGGPNGKLVIIDAREKRLDDIAILNILSPVLGVQVA